MRDESVKSKCFQVADIRADSQTMVDRVMQTLVEYMSSDDDYLTASGYLAAMALARIRAYPDVVLPYLRRWIELSHTAGLSRKYHEQLKEVFAASKMYAQL